MNLAIIQGDALECLARMTSASVQCCVTSPPYWGLRDYGVAGQLGLEKTPEEYVAKMVAVFREVRRVLRDDGVLFLNLGDSYAASGMGGNPEESEYRKQATNAGSLIHGRKAPAGLKPKDLCGIPWRVAFALQADGWYLRQDIIWCLSGGTWLYVKTETSGVCLMTVKDMARLKPQWVQLWNGKEWVYLAGMSKSKRKGDEIEIVLRSGERIACIPTHRFPSSRGLVEAGQLAVGDSLRRCRLPEPYPAESNFMGNDAAWLAGLYLAEGSRSGDTIQISGHAKEADRWNKVEKTVRHYGGTATRSIVGNTMNIRIYGRILNAIIDELVSGRTAHDKGFSPTVWRHSDNFIESMMMGYLGGDGCWDFRNRRWRLGFCRNYNLERDIRTACCRLGWALTLNLSSVAYKGKRVPTFRGELRVDQCGHFNQKSKDEIVAIRMARCRDVYDIGVHGDPHLFALASGILTHNSKPNPMPESVTDRCTKAHEYIFLLSKSERYYYDQEAVKEEAVYPGQGGPSIGHITYNQPGSRRLSKDENLTIRGTTRNRRSVWTITTKPYSEAHFATFPPELPKLCILAGTSARGCCSNCGAPWERVVDYSGETKREIQYRVGESPKNPGAQGLNHAGAHGGNTRVATTTGWVPACTCGEYGACATDDMTHCGTVPCTVLDPFAGSGTTGQVAIELGRKAVLIELNPKYADLIRQRTDVTQGLPL